MLWFVDTVLSLTINETLKWLFIAARHLNAGVVLVVTVFSDRSLSLSLSLYIYIYISQVISLFPHLDTPFPSFSPSLISLMFSVDVSIMFTQHLYGRQLGVKQA